MTPDPIHPEGPTAADDTSPYERLFTGGNTVIPKPAPLKVDTARVILVGTVLWLVALVITLLVPALHEGERDWWPWTCIVGAAFGVLGIAYVRRGRGNAEAA